MAKAGRPSGSGGANTVRELTIGDDKIDLSDSPLVYGEKDKALTGQARTTIEAFENKRYGMKTEYSTFVDANGRVIENNHGNKGNVGATLYARKTADVMSHNHPREEGMLGGPFSAGDMANFSNFNQTTYRATAKEGTYSITKGKNFKGQDFQKAVKAQSDASYQKCKSITDALASDYRAGKMTYSEYRIKAVKANNAMLVDDHNWFMANQKKYGYSYTLERRTGR